MPKVSSLIELAFTEILCPLCDSVKQGEPALHEELLIEIGRLKDLAAREPQLRSINARVGSIGSLAEQPTRSRSAVHIFVEAKGK
jgi:hypothetical protein